MDIKKECNLTRLSNTKFEIDAKIKFPSPTIIQEIEAVFV